MPASLFRLLIVTALITGLAACQSTGGMSALAPSGATSRPPMLIDAVRGPAPDLAQKFEAIFQEEARKRGFVTAPSQAGTVMRLKAYLDAYTVEGGKTGFAWVVETSDDGQNRAIRVKGAAEMTGNSASPWAAFDEKAMRQIATLAIGDLIRLSNGGTEGPAAVSQEE